MAAKASFPLALTAFAVAGSVSLSPTIAQAGIIVGNRTSLNAGANTVDADSIVIGANSAASTSSLAIGFTATADNNSAALGTSAYAKSFGVAVGVTADNSQGYGFAGGYQATAGLNAVAIGYLATGQQNGVAIGYKTQAGTNDVVIGADSATHALSNANTMVFSASPAAGINYSTGARFAVGGVGNERQIRNVAPGVISASSTDAINGSQLYGAVVGINNVGSTTASLLGGTTAYSSATGSLSGFAVTIAGTTYTSVTSAIQAAATVPNYGWNLQSNGDTATAVASGDTLAVNSGSSGNLVVNRNRTTLTVDLAPNLTATSLTTGNTTLTTNGLAITNGPSVLATGIDAGGKAVANIAAGSLTASSTDATNGAQLYATNQAVAAAAATAGKGFNLQANGDTATQVAPGATVQFKDGRNVRITRNGNDVTVSTADNLTGTSLTTGNAVMNTSGFSLTGGPSILASGIFAGNKTVTGVANGAVAATSTDAVNGAQLYAVSQAASSAAATAAQGFNLQANGDAATQVAPGATVQFKNGQNITITRNGSDVTISTAANLTATSLTTGNATLNTSGLTIANGPSVTSSGIDAGGKAVTNLAAGTLSSTSTDAVTGAQLYATNQTVAGLVTTVANSAGVVQRGTTTDTIVLTGAGGTPANPGAAQTLTNVAAGALSATSTDAVNGSQLYATNTNVGQLRDAVDGLAKSDALSVKYVAGGNGKATNTVVLTGDGSGAAVRVTNVAAGTADGDAVNYGQVKNHIAYDTTASGARTGSITLAGPTGGPVRIGNLADGVKDGDAATMRQLGKVRSDSMAYTDTRIAEVQDANRSAFAALSSNIREVRNEARAGVASAMAMANAALPSASGRLTYAVNAATYQGAAAVGGSFAYRFDTSVPLAFTGGVAGSSGYVGGRVSIMGEL